MKEKFTPAMINQMLSYCRWAEESGNYYGYKPQFVNRHKKIVAWLKEFEAEESK